MRFKRIYLNTYDKHIADGLFRNCSNRSPRIGQGLAFGVTSSTMKCFVGYFDFKKQAWWPAGDWPGVGRGLTWW